MGELFLLAPNLESVERAVGKGAHLRHTTPDCRCDLDIHLYSSCAYLVPAWGGITPCQVSRPYDNSALAPERSRDRDHIHLPFSQVPFIERDPPPELFSLVFQGRPFCVWGGYLLLLFFCKSHLLCSKILPLFFKRSLLPFPLPIKAETPSFIKRENALQ